MGGITLNPYPICIKGSYKHPSGMALRPRGLKLERRRSYSSEVTILGRIDRVKTVRTTIGILKCPACEREYETLGRTKGKWLCYRCNYDFGELNERKWVEKDVEGVICDKCGKVVPCTKQNFIIGSPYLEVACPTCKDAENYSHLIAFSIAGLGDRQPAFYT